MTTPSKSNSTPSSPKSTVAKKRNTTQKTPVSTQKKKRVETPAQQKRHNECRRKSRAKKKQADEEEAARNQAAKEKRNARARANRKQKKEEARQQEEEKKKEQAELDARKERFFERNQLLFQLQEGDMQNNQTPGKAAAPSNAQRGAMDPNFIAALSPEIQLRLVKTTMKNQRSGMAEDSIRALTRDTQAANELRCDKADQTIRSMTADTLETNRAAAKDGVEAMKEILASDLEDIDLTYAAPTATAGFGATAPAAAAGTHGADHAGGGFGMPGTAPNPVPPASSSGYQYSQPHQSNVPPPNAAAFGASNQAPFSPPPSGPTHAAPYAAAPGPFNAQFDTPFSPQRPQAQATNQGPPPPSAAWASTPQPRGYASPPPASFTSPTTPSGGQPFTATNGVPATASAGNGFGANNATFTPQRPTGPAGFTTASSGTQPFGSPPPQQNATWATRQPAYYARNASAAGFAPPQPSGNPGLTTPTTQQHAARAPAGAKHQVGAEVIYWPQDGGRFPAHVLRVDAKDGLPVYAIKKVANGETVQSVDQKLLSETAWVYTGPGGDEDDTQMPDPTRNHFDGESAETEHLFSPGKGSKKKAAAHIPRDRAHFDARRRNSARDPKKVHRHGDGTPADSSHADGTPLKSTPGASSSHQK